MAGITMEWIEGRVGRIVIANWQAEDEIQRLHIENAELKQKQKETSDGGNQEPS